jgi:lysozyme family protein
VPAPAPALPTYFERAVEITLGYEGEESNHPDDPGGLTRFGIAQKWHPEVDVAALTRAEAIHLLEVSYWWPIQGELLPWPLGAATFDHAVHSGARRAVAALQEACGAFPDGSLGPLTRAALARAWPASPRGVLGAALRIRARELAKAPKAGPFLSGWMARVADLGLLCGYELGQAAKLRAA